MHTEIIRTRPWGLFKIIGISNVATYKYQAYRSGSSAENTFFSTGKQIVTTKTQSSLVSYIATNLSTVDIFQATSSSLA